ncbi:MAG: Stp1/IreP family PP2C-type Ser/Thr phosphatase, partial [Bacteriovoracaceae bacterium]|nr:Stp1/IreP family PP2C-type Ser/Thr phosphatase [Bacteriovoracaceae bacterium]
MKIEIIGLTDVGRKRDHNEDCLLINKDLNMAIVCDGMGGHAAGEVASKITTEVINNHIVSNQMIVHEFQQKPNSENSEKLKSLVQEAVVKACGEVWYEGNHDESKKGMGTTLVMMIAAGSHAFVAHVGDSRNYLVRQGEVHQVTEDHSYVNEMVRQGVLTREQASKSPHANIITRCIGQQEFVQVDILQMELLDGDRFLLCSDGLCEYLPDEELAKIMKKEREIPRLPKIFIDYANKKGGKDNITAVVLQVGELGNQAEVDNVVRKVQALKGIPMFKHFDYKEMNKTLEIIKSEDLETGETIITEGTSGEDMFIILDGKVQVEKAGIKMAQLGSGAYFGEMSLIDKVKRSAT